MNSFFQAFFLDEDGDVDPELMLAKKKAMDNAKTPVAAPELDTKPVKKADTPAAEKKPATKESKPVNREGKPCPEKVVQKKLCQRKGVEIVSWHVSLVCDSVYLEFSFIGFILFFWTLLLLKTIEKPS